MVHSAEDFNSSVLIDDEFLRFAAKQRFGALHAGNIIGILACKEVMPTRLWLRCLIRRPFHYTALRYIYALPYQAYEEWRIRKYGLRHIAKICVP